MRTAFLAVLLALVALPASGQRRPPTEVLALPEGQQAKLLAYNVALGAAIGGLGAVVNGRAEDPWAQRLLRGSLGGAAGGVGLYAGKRLTSLVADARLEAGLLAVAVHEVGASVVENAARDVAPLDRLTLHTGPLRWEWEPRGGVRARVLPLNVVATLVMASRYRLDVRGSLATATPIFSGSGAAPYPLFDGGGRQSGFALLNTAYVFADAADVPEVLAHELVHVLQYREYMRTTALHVPLARALDDEAWYDTLSRHVYFDNVHVFAFGYQVAAGGVQPTECYFNNWFEREAETLSTNADVRVCVPFP